MQPQKDFGAVWGNSPVPLDSACSYCASFRSYVIPNAFGAASVQEYGHACDRSWPVPPSPSENRTYAAASSGAVGKSTSVR